MLAGEDDRAFGLQQLRIDGAAARIAGRSPESRHIAPTPSE